MDSYPQILSEMTHPFDQHPVERSSNSRSVTLPAWLSQQPPSSPAPVPKSLKELEELQFEYIFERVLEEIAKGNWIGPILEQDGRNFEPVRYMRWIRADATRRGLYEAAQEIATEKMTYDRIRIADAVDNPLEDVARSRLRVEVRKDIAGSHNRKRYAPTQSVEVTTSISITTALADAQARVIENITDVEFTEDNL